MTLLQYVHCEFYLSFVHCDGVKVIFNLLKPTVNYTYHQVKH
jgi:hypothetical protein